MSTLKPEMASLLGFNGESKESEKTPDLVIRQPGLGQLGWPTPQHQTDTSEWILSVIGKIDGWEQWVESITKYNIAVDYDDDTAPERILSLDAQSWHFNTTEREERNKVEEIEGGSIPKKIPGLSKYDSRIRHAVDGINACYLEEGDVIKKSIGRGLHSLQDAFAHSDEFVTNVVGAFAGRLFFSYFTHANYRGWNADEIHCFTDNSGGQGSVRMPPTAATATAPYKMTAEGVDVNGRYALTQLATWLYLGCCMAVIYDRTGDNKYNIASEKLGKQFCEKLNFWNNDIDHKPALNSFLGFVELCEARTIKNKLPRIRFIFDKRKELDDRSIGEIVKYAPSLDRGGVSIINPGSDVLEAWNYKNAHGDSPDLKQIKYFNAYNNMLKDDYVEMTLQCVFQGRTGWLAIGKDGYAQIVNDLDSATSLRLERNGNSTCHFDIYVLNKKNGEKCGKLDCVNGSSGWIYMYSLTEATNPWWFSSDSVGCSVTMGSWHWEGCQVMIYESGHFAVLNNKYLTSSTPVILQFVPDMIARSSTAKSSIDDQSVVKSDVRSMTFFARELAANENNIRTTIEEEMPKSSTPINTP